MSTQIEQDAPPAKAAREELHQGIIPLDEEGTVCFQSSSAELLTQALGFSLHVEDDFFEATVEDAKMRQRELQQKLHDLNEAPLLTRALREAREEARRPKYISCVVRVSFPDEAQSGWYLQSRFKPQSCISDVKARFRPFLTVESDDDFVLYTRTPKRVELDPKSSLMTGGLCPAVLMHVDAGSSGAGSAAAPKTKILLTEETKKKVSSMEEVVKLTQKNRMEARLVVSSGPETDKAGPSGADKGREETSAERPKIARTPTNQIPKWFKSGMKK